MEGIYRGGEVFPHLFVVIFSCPYHMDVCNSQDGAELGTLDLNLFFFSLVASYCSFLHSDIEGMAMKFWKPMNCLQKVLSQISTVFIYNHNIELSE